jgi:hypothetical protein
MVVRHSPILLAEAREFLLRGESAHKDNASFQYNLACYETQLGHMDSAKARLCRAFELNPNFRLTALEDEELTPFW